MIDLNNARQQCHYAVQLNTRLARGFIPAKADDSQTSLVWRTTCGQCQRGALAGHWVDSPSGMFRLAVCLANLTLSLLDADGDVLDTFPLDCRTVADALAWLGAHLKAKGLDPAGLSAPLHFELEDHPLAHGAPFSLSRDPAGIAAEFDALARHYANAAALLREVRVHEPRASEVLCWPHHFDIATLITVSGRGEQAETIGVGLSPGDESYREPYYYVTPYPHPDQKMLPLLQEGGFWNTRGWTGAVLPARSLPVEAIRGFLKDAMGKLEMVSAGR